MHVCRIKTRSSIVDNEWLDKYIRKNHGPLGAEHPHTEYLMEGDTPNFLGLVNNGLNSPENPNWGGCGGRYEFYTPRVQKWFKNRKRARSRPTR